MQGTCWETGARPSFFLSRVCKPPANARAIKRDLTKGGGILSKRAREITEKSEINRLKRIYKNLPPNQYAVAQGLIVQAARLRVRLDRLWQEIQEGGETEMFAQSDKTEPYERERPAARLFTATDKNYQSIIKQLNELTPSVAGKSKLAELMKDE